MAVDEALVQKFSRAAFALLPKGMVWQPTANRKAVVDAMAAEAAKQSQRALDLLRESDPRTAVETIADWEAALGLQGPTGDPVSSPTTEQRRSAIVARLQRKLGSSVQNYVDLAAQLGFTVTIREYSYSAPARMGSRLRDSIWSEAWCFYWEVTSPANSVQVARMGSRLGDRLRAWSNVPLETLFGIAKPAHTYVGFVYV